MTGPTPGERMVYLWSGCPVVTVVKVGRSKVLVRFEDANGPYMQGHEGWFFARHLRPLPTSPTADLTNEVAR